MPFPLSPPCNVLQLPRTHLVRGLCRGYQFAGSLDTDRELSWLYFGEVDMASNGYVLLYLATAYHGRDFHCPCCGDDYDDVTVFVCPPVGSKDDLKSGYWPGGPMCDSCWADFGPSGDPDQMDMYLESIAKRSVIPFPDFSGIRIGGVYFSNIYHCACGEMGSDEDPIEMIVYDKNYPLTKPTRCLNCAPEYDL